MIAECGLCSDWLAVCDEDDAEAVAEMFSQYAQHMWTRHPREARNDVVAVSMIRVMAQHQASTS